ncbi:hypothetical protein BG011_007568 [Mortierella polycephala]|uniref:Uncharacterized protein n=1 Tax=Mortierella polycephala TaxID=41804 RepID=A0A9P6QA54_9FUNG|nr:hypothetical protein BG011_007568 [Mortierella polycephala]
MTRSYLTNERTRKRKSSPIPEVSTETESEELKVSQTSTNTDIDEEDEEDEDVKEMIRALQEKLKKKCSEKNANTIKKAEDWISATKVKMDVILQTQKQQHDDIVRDYYTKLEDLQNQRQLCMDNIDAAKRLFINLNDEAMEELSRSNNNLQIAREQFHAKLTHQLTSFDDATPTYQERDRVNLRGPQDDESVPILGTKTAGNVVVAPDNTWGLAPLTVTGLFDIQRSC